MADLDFGLFHQNISNKKASFSFLKGLVTFKTRASESWDISTKEAVIRMFFSFLKGSLLPANTTFLRQKGYPSQGRFKWMNAPACFLKQYAVENIQ